MACVHQFDVFPVEMLQRGFPKAADTTIEINNVSENGEYSDRVVFVISHGCFEKYLFIFCF